MQFIGAERERKIPLRTEDVKNRSGNKFVISFRLKEYECE
jgi:hypothetical protein